MTGKFWEFVKLDKLPLHTPTDVMLVQLTHRPNNKIKYRVIRVLKYNRLDIDTQLSDDEISKITCAVVKNKIDESNISQIDLFDKL